VDEYRQRSRDRSSIGAHLRHALEHVQCLVDAVETGTVDYDRRARDPRLEEQPEALCETVLWLRERLAMLGEGALERPLNVRESAAPDTGPTETRSTIARELTFLSGHTLHHLEIAGLIAALQGIDIPVEWSLAYSTAAWRATTGTPYAAD